MPAAGAPGSVTSLAPPSRTSFLGRCVSQDSSSPSSCRIRRNACGLTGPRRCVPTGGRLATARSSASWIASHIEGTTAARKFKQSWLVYCSALPPLSFAGFVAERVAVLAQFVVHGLSVAAGVKLLRVVQILDERGAGAHSSPRMSTNRDSAGPGYADERT